MSFRPLALMVLLLAACGRKADKATETTALRLTTPATLDLHQRSSVELPGSQGKLHLQIDDITHGQVLTSVIGPDQQDLTPAQSLREQGTLDFAYEGQTYRLTLTRMINQMIGDDSAMFLLETAGVNTGMEIDPARKASEEIDALLSSLHELDGAVFIRNGRDYPVAKAIEHLQNKRNAVGKPIPSAETFIETIGSRSSSSGKDYRIRFKDGTETSTREWFTKKLAELRANPAGPK